MRTHLSQVFENGVLPFSHLKSRAAKQEIQSGLILSQPDGRFRHPQPPDWPAHPAYAACPEEVYDIMLQAWEKDADARPTFSEFHEKIRNLLLQEEQGSEVKARDIGASLNAVLSQTMRRLSMKASVVRRQGGSVSGLMFGQRALTRHGRLGILCRWLQAQGVCERAVYHA